MISLRAVRVVFGNTAALDGLDLDIHPGVTGVFGQNGAGKSTLLRVLAGLVQPTSGVVSVDDRRVSSADEGFRRRVGYAGHESGLYSHLTVQENVSLFATLYGAPPGNVEDAVESVGLAARRHTRVADLSAGLRRRAAVARAVVHDPAVLLLDEPYANLDDDAAEQVSALIRRWKRPGAIAVVATHGAKRVKGFADGSLILRDGRPVSYRVHADESGAS